MATKKQPSLSNIFDQLNAGMVDAAQTLDQTLPWRDQVFELLMARLDVAFEHYTTLQPWWHSLSQDAAAKSQAWANANYAMRLLKHYVPQAPHVWVMVWVYKQTLDVFYAHHANPDLGPDQAFDKSMVALDQALDKYQSLTSGAWLKSGKDMAQQFFAQKGV